MLTSRYTDFFSYASAVGGHPNPPHIKGKYPFGAYKTSLIVILETWQIFLKCDIPFKKHESLKTRFSNIPINLHHSG